MSAPAPPQIPPRPVRAHQAAAAAGVSQLPEVPPRPKRLDRSISPGNYPRSPLNDPPFVGTLDFAPQVRDGADRLPRPPSVSHLPSIGQEGLEYASIQYEPVVPSSALAADAAAQTRSVGHDLQLHAPRPSLPQSSAKARVEAVTRTDSSQAAQHGFGKPPTPAHDDHEPLRQIRTRSSFSRPASSASHERRRSLGYAEDQTPGELGLRVPINPQLGDVQAPSPAPFGSVLTPSQTGDNRRRHHRTKSGREVFLPPGSYGLHGHGLPPVDKFEKDWYAKHPEELQHEEAHGHGVYEGLGSGRGTFALSSNDLNRIVRGTASRGAGNGANGNHLSYPDEQIGYEASDQYVSRSQMTTPVSKVQSHVSQPAAESPFHRTPLPTEDSGTSEFRKSNDSVPGKSDDTVESENEGVQISEPAHRYGKITGGEETMHEREQLAWNGGEGDLIEGYSAPILAEDEVAKEAGSEHLHPAVSPRYDRRGSAFEFEPRTSGDVTPISRPTSRPGSIHGIHGLHSSLSRFTSHQEDDREPMHTPLEAVDEYEPLFPEEDAKQNSLSQADRFKARPDSLRHKFPSQDIWEDAPSSAYYVATVSTPDLPAQTTSTAQTAKTLFEGPDSEAARKERPVEEKKTAFVPADAKLPMFAAHLRSEMSNRPGLQPRFPSQDIWEDSPDSHYLVTTVQSPSVEDEPPLPESSMKPTVPPRLTNKIKVSEGTSTVPPAIPPRPQKRIQAVPPVGAKVTEVVPSNKSDSRESSPTELRKVPSLPDRPKPQVPPRPAKKESLEGLAKTTSPASAGSTGSVETEKSPPMASPPSTQAKPDIPTKPGPSGKLTNLKGNFMNDLNQRLGLGPPKEKEKDPEAEEVKPLEDARKGRARGPQRRAPAKSPLGDAKSAKFSLSTPMTLWHISPDDNSLTVLSHDASKAEPTGGFDAVKGQMSEDKAAQMDSSTVADAPPAPTVDTREEGLETTDEGRSEAQPNEPFPMAPPGLATNTAGEPVDLPLAGPTQERSDPLEAPVQLEGGATLSQRTTASSGAASGPPLEPSEADANRDAIPLSQQETSNSTVTGDSLRQIESRKSEPEAIELRDEQVGASAPGPTAAAGGPIPLGLSGDGGTKGIVAPEDRLRTSSATTREEAEREEKAAGADEPMEPMNEEDIDYKQLEEMTAQADGKEHAPEDPGEESMSARKIMD